MKNIFWWECVWILGPLSYKKNWKYEQRFSFSSQGKSDWSSVHIHDLIFFEKWPKFRSRTWTERELNEKSSVPTMLCSRYNMKANRHSLVYSLRAHLKNNNIVSQFLAILTCSKRLPLKHSIVICFFLISNFVLKKKILNPDTTFHFRILWFIFYLLRQNIKLCYNFSK